MNINKIYVFCCWLLSYWFFVISLKTDIKFDIDIENILHKHQHSSSENNRKFLIISIIENELKPDINTLDFPSLSSVINHEYAFYHGYDYLCLHNTNEHNIQEQINKLFPDLRANSNQQSTKRNHFHFGLKQYRSAPWGKIPLLWYVNKLLMDQYEFIWYIDSDAVISPLHLNRSIEESLELWSKTPTASHKILYNTYPHHNSQLNDNNQLDLHSNSYVKYGQKDLSKTYLIFFNNFPWREDLPCSGSFFFRPSQTMDAIFRQWWDFDIGDHMINDQDALWHIIEAEYWIELERIQRKTGSIPFKYQHLPGYNTFQTPEAQQWLSQAKGKHYAMNTSVYSILSEVQFPSDFHRYEDLWIVHITSYNYHLRVPILTQFLNLLHSYNSFFYKIQINHLLNAHVSSVGFLELCQLMEEASLNTSNQSLISPQHNLKTQFEWYSEHKTSKNPEIYTELPLEKLFEKRLIRHNYELYLVQNGLKRKFDSFETIVQLGLDLDMGHRLKPQGFKYLQDSSSVITRNISNKEQNQWLQYYQPLIIQKKQYQWISQLKELQSGQCIPHTALEQMVKYYPMRTKLWIFAKDDNEEKTGLIFIQCFKDKLSFFEDFWMSIQRLSNNFFGDIEIYHKLFTDSSKTMISWQELDYFILTNTQSIQFQDKNKNIETNNTRLTVDIIYSYLNYAKEHSYYDVIPFYRSKYPMMKHAIQTYGDSFQIIWDTLLFILGYSEQQIRSFDQQNIFLHHSFLIKPLILSKLTAFMQRVMFTIENNSKLQNLFSKNNITNYPQDIFQQQQHQLNQSDSSSYYTYIFERLPSFYLFIIHANVCLSDSGFCQYNS